MARRLTGGLPMSPFMLATATVSAAAEALRARTVLCQASCTIGETALYALVRT